MNLQSSSQTSCPVYFIKDLGCFPITWQTTCIQAANYLTTVGLLTPFRGEKCSYRKFQHCTTTYNSCVEIDVLFYLY